VSRAKPWPDNAPGTWHVDTGCIDCGCCRVVAPSTFGEADDHAFVREQPSSPELLHRAGMALVACPVHAIHGEGADLRAAAASFPDPVAPGVYACGFASAATFGASSWLVVRPDGNVLVDVPRPVPALLDRIRALGGVRTLFLTHRDDIDGHDKMAAAFGCERVMHAADRCAASEGVEHYLDGDSTLAPGVDALHLPGHTQGSMALLVDGSYLFSGDHLWGRGPRGWVAEGAEGGLGAGRSVCWYDWREQIRSMERLLDHDFAAVYPGHGRPWTGGREARQPALQRLIAWMREVS